MTICPKREKRERRDAPMLPIFLFKHDGLRVVGSALAVTDTATPCEVLEITHEGFVIPAYRISEGYAICQDFDRKVVKL